MALHILDRTVLFSYQQPVAAYAKGVYYKTDKFYSKTTSDHISKWTGKSTVIVSQAFIDSLLDIEGDAS